MTKFIFFVIVSMLIANLFIPFLVEGIGYFLIIINYLKDASVIILSCLIAAFGSMESYYYIKLLYYIGIMFLILNIVFKIVTNHYITLKEDDSEYQNDLKFQKNLEKEKEIHYLHNPNNKKLKSEYLQEKGTTKLFESEHMKNLYKENGKIKKKLKLERRKK